MAGRDQAGRFTPGYHPDRGRGRPPRPRDYPLLEDDLRRVVMETANLPVSIARGRGRQVTTLFEALVRGLPTGKLPHRAAVVAFLRLVIQSAGVEPGVLTATRDLAIMRVKSEVERLQTLSVTPESIAIGAAKWRLVNELLAATKARRSS